MREHWIMICEDSMEGIWTAVYDGWKYANQGYFVEISTEESDAQRLFATFERVETDQEKAMKVSRSVRRKLGFITFGDLCYAAVSTHPDKGTAVFQVLYQAMSHGRNNRNILQEAADPYVNLVMKLRVKVWHEYHRFLGFVRFREVADRVLFSVIRPENDVLELMAPHFCDRLPRESWMIYDEGRGKVLLHPAGGECTVRRDVHFSAGQAEWLETSEGYEELWRTFCQAVSITERTNPSLQKQLLPLKFRSNMAEFS